MNEHGGRKQDALDCVQKIPTPRVSSLESSMSGRDPRWSRNNPNQSAVTFGNQINLNGTGPNQITREQYERNVAALSHQRQLLQQSIDNYSINVMQNEIAYRGVASVATRA